MILLFYSMEGGELFQRIQDRQDEGPFTERGTIEIFYILSELQIWFFIFYFYLFTQRQLKLCMKYAWL